MNRISTRTRGCRGALAARGLQQGFTLIELMVTVAIVAILSAVALPSYNSYVQRGRVPAALEGLNAYFVRMEQRFQDNGTYANGGNCGVAVLPTASNFTFACVLSGGGTGYTLSATGSGTMTGYTYTINQDGVRRTTAHPKGTPTSNCWSTKGSVCDT